MKRCTACGQRKPLSEFYSNGAGEKKSRCGPCFNRIVNATRWTPEFRARKAAYLRANRARPTARAREVRHARAYRERYPEKTRAKQQLSNALRRGAVTRPEKCEACGIRGRMHGHHHNGYDRPLDVQWLCHRCHSAVHRAQPVAPPEGPR